MALDWHCHSDLSRLASCLVSLHPNLSVPTGHQIASCLWLGSQCHLFACLCQWSDHRTEAGEICELCVVGERNPHLARLGASCSALLTHLAFEFHWNLLGMGWRAASLACFSLRLYHKPALLLHPPWVCSEVPGKKEQSERCEEAITGTVWEGHIQEQGDHRGVGPKQGTRRASKHYQEH